MKKMEKMAENYIWKDRKRPIFGLPLSFTKYKLTNEKRDRESNDSRSLFLV